MQLLIAETVVKHFKSMNTKHLGSLLNNWEQSFEKLHKSYFGYFRTISTLAIALIGLIIGLKPEVIPEENAKVFFIIGISLLGLCIIFSLVVQYYEVNQYRQETKIRKDQVLDYVQDPESNNLQLSEINKHWIFILSEYLTFISLILSIAALIGYVYFSEFI